jgi:hypothetical protein
LHAGCATPLTKASASGDIQRVKSLLDNGADINEEGTDYSGGHMPTRAPLMWALENKHFDIAKLLVERGADVNKHCCGYNYPVVLAACNGDTALINLMLEKGANVNQNEPWGGDLYLTPLTMAAACKNRPVIDFLLQKGTDLEEILTLCERNTSSWTLGGHYEACLATLKPIKDKQDRIAQQKEKEQGASKTNQIETYNTKEMKDLIKEVVKESALQKTDSKTASIQSDIDKPSFGPSKTIVRDNDLAVIIGIEGYQNVPKSDFSYNDAKLVKEYVKALGYKERNIDLLTDEKATLSGITKSIEAWLRNKAKADSRVFVYYSGHGAPEPSTGEAYLVPYDGDPNYLSITGYPINRLYDKLGKLQAKEVIIVLDACFSGAGGRSVLAKGTRPLVMVAKGPVMNKNMVVLTATQGMQISTSSPDKGHGLLTYYFLKAIKDGKGDLAEIYEQIKPQIEDEAKALNIQQSPSLSPSEELVKGKFHLR